MKTKINSQLDKVMASL